MNTRVPIFVLLLLSAMPALPCRAQSVADAARQEQARRQNKKSSTKVFTNDDLSRYAEEPQASTAQSAAEATQPADRQPPLLGPKDSVPVIPTSVPGVSDSSTQKLK